LYTVDVNCKIINFIYNYIDTENVIVLTKFYLLTIWKAFTISNPLYTTHINTKILQNIHGHINEMPAEIVLYRYMKT